LAPLKAGQEGRNWNTGGVNGPFSANFPDAGYVMPHLIWLFVCAVASHWLVLMSGVGSVALAVYQRIKGSTDWFWPLAVAFLFIGFFLAWNDQFERAESLQAQISKQAISSLRVWRRLTDDQKKTLTGMLRNEQSKIALSCNDSGCLGLEKDFVDIFRAAGWRVTSGASTDAIASGILIEGAQDDHLASNVREEIQRVTGFSIDYFIEPTLGANGTRMILIIGTKPL
jgi:hypothetical protein